MQLAAGRRGMAAKPTSDRSRAAAPLARRVARVAVRAQAPSGPSAASSEGGQCPLRLQQQAQQQDNKQRVAAVSAGRSNTGTIEPPRDDLPLPPQNDDLMLPFWGESSALMADPLAFGVDAYKRFGPIYRTTVLGRDYYMINDADTAAALLKEDGYTVAFSATPAFGKLLGEYSNTV